MELDFLQSRSGCFIPLVDGRILHSKVDPQREAEELVSREWDKIKDVRSVIVLGLGGGFHVEALLNRKIGRIVVIEAFRNLAAEVIQRKPELSDRFDLLAEVPPPQILAEPEIIDAVGQSFALVRHPASLQVAPYYYSAVTELIAQRTLSTLRKLARGNIALTGFLDSLDISSNQLLTLPMIEEAMARRGTGFDKESLIWMTMRELVV